VPGVRCQEKQNLACGARLTHAPFFQRHWADDLGDGLAYREGFTTSTADAVVAHLVNARGVALDRASAPEPGRLVFVYHKTPTAVAEGAGLVSALR
jgi:hypothetical protein